MERRLIDEYASLHATSDYGRSGYKMLPFLLPHVMALRPGSLIDYGCGRSALADMLSERIAMRRVVKFDPAVPQWSKKPDGSFDLLINVDVLEHVPDEEIDGVVAEMASMTRHALIIIDTRPAKARLSDGRDAHVSQHDEAWWLDRLRRFFPTLRPIRAYRHGRVGFKTFDDELPSLRAFWVRGREVCRRHALRWWRILTRTGRTK